MCATERAPARVPMHSDLLRTTTAVMVYLPPSAVLASHHGCSSAFVWHNELDVPPSVRQWAAGKPPGSSELISASFMSIMLFGSGW